MDNLRMGKEGSWISVKNWIPGRVQYLYWDTNTGVGQSALMTMGQKVRFKKIKFIHPDFPFEGRFITGWARDKEEIEKYLDAISSTLKKHYPEYNIFLKKWHHNILEFDEKFFSSNNSKK